MNTEKQPVLCTTLYRKPMQPCNFDGILYQLRTEFFHTVFTRRSVLKGTLRRDQKVIFVKSPISSHGDALNKYIVQQQNSSSSRKYKIFTIVICHVSVTVAWTNQIDARTLRDSVISHVPFTLVQNLASTELTDSSYADCKSPP